MALHKHFRYKSSESGLNRFISGLTQRHCLQTTHGRTLFKDLPAVFVGHLF
jgi:hypothetical protein